MKKKLIALVLLAVLLILAVQPAVAQSYRFRVLKTVANVYINKDGTQTIEYYITFQNQTGVPAIDFVDVGVPKNGDYDFKSVSAEVAGKKITDIQKSEYVKPGIALGLGANAIRAGQTGEVHVLIPLVRREIYESDLKDLPENYASINFQPNYFGCEYVVGSTDLSVSIFFPADVNAEEPRYHQPVNWPGAKDPTTGALDSGVKYYTWQSSSASACAQYQFGASFPARVVPANTIQKKPAVNISLNINEEDLCCAGMAIFGFIFVGLSIYGAIWGSKARKLKYLPPKLAIEGMGVKRGLTAVEAAILMEQPMDKILTMILFSTVKKNAAVVSSKDPLKVDAVQPQPEGLYPYEKSFIEAFTESNQAVRRRLLQNMMVDLVKSLTEKMKGFSRKETIDYYTTIMRKAWEQVEAAATPEVKMQKFDEAVDWTMLDKNFDDRTREVFRTGPVFIPTWWGRVDPTIRPTIQNANVPAPSGGGQISIPLPSLPGSDFAASIVNSVQSFAGGVMGNLTSFTGGVTDKTNPVPTSTYTASKGGGSSGGRSCACACACACAGCACACAGGGR